MEQFEKDDLPRTKFSFSKSFSPFSLNEAEVDAVGTGKHDALSNSPKKCFSLGSLDFSSMEILIL
jgi:hypothetical protein